MRDNQGGNSGGRGVGSDGPSASTAVLWCFEAELKARFSQLLQHLSATLKDNAAEFRKFGVREEDVCRTSGVHCNPK